MFRAQRHQIVQIRRATVTPPHDVVQGPVREPCRAAQVQLAGRVRHDSVADDRVGVGVDDHHVVGSSGTGDPGGAVEQRGQGVCR